MIPIISRPWYTVELQQSGSYPIIHCDIHSPWTKAVKENLVRDWETFRFLANTPIIAMHWEDQDYKHIKFLDMMGFEYSHTIIRDGKSVDVYLIDKEDSNGIR